MHSPVNMFFSQPLLSPLLLLPLLLPRLLVVPLLLLALLLAELPALLLLALRCSWRYTCSKSALYTGEPATFRAFCRFAMASSGTLAMNPAHGRKNQGAQHTNTWYVGGVPEPLLLLVHNRVIHWSHRIHARSRIRHQLYVLPAWHHAPPCWHDSGCSR